MTGIMHNDECTLQKPPISTHGKGLHMKEVRDVDVDAGGGRGKGMKSICSFLVSFFSTCPLPLLLWWKPIYF